MAYGPVDEALDAAVVAGLELNGGVIESGTSGVADISKERSPGSNDLLCGVRWRRSGDDRRELVELVDVREGLAGAGVGSCIREKRRITNPGVQVSESS